MGPIACKALAQDFVDWRDKAEAFVGEPNNDCERGDFYYCYQKLADIFTAAAEVDGVVLFG